MTVTENFVHLLWRKVVVCTVIAGPEVPGYAVEVSKDHTGMPQHRQVSSRCPEWIVCAFLGDDSQS